MIDLPDPRPEMTARSQETRREQSYFAPPIEQLPEIVLANWCVLMEPNGDCRVAGCNVASDVPRLSTRVIRAVGRRITTQSSRVYVLRRAGIDEGARALIGRYLQAGAIEHAVLLAGENAELWLEAVREDKAAQHQDDKETT